MDLPIDSMVIFHIYMGQFARGYSELTESANKWTLNSIAAEKNVWIHCQHCDISFQEGLY